MGVVNKCWIHGAVCGLYCLYFTRIFILVKAVLPPPHRRHLARSLPVPRGRMATGGCLTTLAFSVNMKSKTK